MGQTLLRFRAAQCDAFRNLSLEAFLNRVFEHQVKFGIIRSGAEYGDCRSTIARHFTLADSYGFKTEKHLMVIMDCIAIFGEQAVVDALTAALGTPQMRVNHVICVLEAPALERR